MLRWRRTDRGALVVVAVFLLLAVAGLFVRVAPDPALTNFPPFVRGHLFGTDPLGRDIFAACVQATPGTLALAVVGALAVTAVGATLGLLGAIVRGYLDPIIARLTEALSAFPAFISVLVLQGLVPHPTLWTVALAVVLTRWPEIARPVRAMTLSLLRQDFVLASRALGSPRRTVIVRQILPHVLPEMLVLGCSSIGAIVLVEALVTFMGIRVTDAPSWGGLMGLIVQSRGSWWLAAGPSLFLAPVLWALHTLSDNLRLGVPNLPSDRGKSD